LAYKDAGDQEKAIAAFQHVEKIAPEEPDAFYFEGFMNAQLQRYDDAIIAFKKALELAPFHASAQFGLARAYQRKGDAESARKHEALSENSIRETRHSLWRRLWRSGEILSRGICAWNRHCGAQGNSRSVCARASGKKPHSGRDPGSQRRRLLSGLRRRR